MNYLFDSVGLEVLDRFARSRTLLALDFDGTLAPIVRDRGSAHMRPSTAELLRAACGRFPTAVISGRGCADVAPRVAGARVKHLIGNHGIEPSPDAARFEAETASVRARLGAELGDRADIDIEDKRFSLAIHYRKAQDPEAARAAILHAIGSLPRAPRLVLGKSVINLVPADAPHKGSALERLRAEEGAETAIYVGDDVTDEDVFALERADWLLGIRVGESATSKARYFLREQAEIDILLERLIAARAEAGAP